MPRRNGQYACWPQLDRLPALVESNLALKASHKFDVLDISAADFRRICLEDWRRAARSYAREIDVPRPSMDRTPLIATGHQPELYHCGVWIKNHLAGKVAVRMEGDSLNLIVDNDVPRHVGLVLPVEQDGLWSREEAPFARALPHTAFEEHPARLEKPGAFTKAAAGIAAGQPFEARAGDLASRLVASDGTGISLGDVTTRLRLSYEREEGLANVELPVSRLSRTRAFGIFVAAILADAERFAAVHNEALADYRREHGIRSKANPIPDLDVAGDFVEVPFWVWREGEPRARLHVRRSGDSVILREGRSEAAMLEVSACEAAERSWEAVVATGLKIRPRALTTTIFMRMFLADLFIHGIGGAKYDEVTDRIIRAFYRVDPPPYATITCSLMLEWPFEPADPAEPGRLKQALRGIRYNPQRHIVGKKAPVNVRALIDEKWRLVESTPRNHDERLRKFTGIRAINRTLAGGLEPLRRETLTRLEETHARLEADKVLFSREYCSFLVGARRAADFYDKVLSPLAVKSS
ncbi:MAG: hypothetical protein ACYTAN_02220 [Planctomycetota bacterium]